MKYLLLFSFFIAFNFYSFSQFGEPYKFTKIVLKSGKSLTGWGKTSGKGFKFKTSSSEKPYLIEFSTIDYIQQKNWENESKKYKFYQSNTSDKFIRAQELIAGETQELYAIITTGNAKMAGGGSFPMTSIKYYLKKKNEEKLTEIGIYDPVFSDFTNKVKNYFSDCPKLIKEIQDKKLRYRDGLEKMVEFYNNNCILN